MFLNCLRYAAFHCSDPLNLCRKEDGVNVINKVASQRQGVTAVQLVWLVTMGVWVWGFCGHFYPTFIFYMFKGYFINNIFKLYLN